MIVFSGKHRRPFREVNPVTGRPQMHKVKSLREDAVYAAGGVESLQAMTGWKAGDVLYCGDSLFADLVDAHRANGWHTAAIINELEEEISVSTTHAPAHLTHPPRTHMHCTDTRWHLHDFHFSACVERLQILQCQNMQVFPFHRTHTHPAHPLMGGCR